MSMERLEKFQKNLVEEVCRGLLGEEHLVNDVKKTLNLTLDPKKAKEIREATLDHFSKLSKKSMEKADEKYNFSGKFARLDEQVDDNEPCSSSAADDVDLHKSFKQVTWPTRRALLLEYEEKLKDEKHKLQAELEEVFFIILSLDGSSLKKIRGLL
ncbi:unnamed protein product [Meloidogyne enterolobii]|uniref:Uncharacterized protein n=1 Tax=Meloidogyne enterolobii TaxID=390850 RepID=A0ACB0Z0A9_MELEN